MRYRLIYRFGQVELYVNGQFCDCDNTWTGAARKLDRVRYCNRKRK